MARHRSSSGRRRHPLFGRSPARGIGGGTHRLPRPDPTTRGRALTAAVAAGALAVAGHSLQASAADTEKTSVVSQMALIDSSPAAEVIRFDAVDPAVDVQALSRAVERADQAAQAAERAAYAQTLRDRLGKPYVAGNNHSLDGWIAKALGLMGLPQALAPGVKKIIMHESTGNPHAINNWDSNAARGTPSQGLMQTIPSTFRACALPSLRDRKITDPVANITAGVRSMITHHGVSALLNGGRRDSSGGYLGYGGSGCSSYDISRYEEQLRDLWDDEPLPEG
ncbi:MAG: transglycosylase SLT domain-containing protein [Pseudonocardiaceae bacterium]